MKTYRVNVRHGAKYWLVEVPEIERSTQARHLREVEEMARDLISIIKSINPDEIELEVRIEVPDEARPHLDLARDYRAAATDANTRAASESRAAARAMREHGLTVRDIGQVLGVSHQRAHQLVSAQERDLR